MKTEATTYDTVSGCDPVNLVRHTPGFDAFDLLCMVLSALVILSRSKISLGFRVPKRIVWPSKIPTSLRCYWISKTFSTGFWYAFQMTILPWAYHATAYQENKRQFALPTILCRKSISSSCKKTNFVLLGSTQMFPKTTQNRESFMYRLYRKDYRMKKIL